MRWIIAIAALALLAAGLLADVVQPLYRGDGTGLTWAASAVAVLGTLSRAGLRAWIVKHGLTLMLGFLGTVIGFWGALEGLAGGDDVAKVDGVATALTTTIVGLVAHLYLMVVQRAADE